MVSRTKTFCFENSIFLTFGLGIREGVSEGSRNESHSHPYHVGIQVGSCIFLSVFGCNYMCT